MMRTSGSDGFTLLEMLVVLTIAVALAAGAVLTARPFAPSIDKTADRVARIFQLARADALSSGEPETVFVDVEGRRVLRQDGESLSLADADITAETAASVTEAHGLPGITFFPDGGATGGRVALVAEGRSAQIQVRWLTGAVRRD